MVWETQPDPINMVGSSGESDVSAAEVIATGSTEGRTLAARFAEIYNAKDYGATGDGATDDTDEIEATLDAAEATGGTVYFPRGTYNYATSPNFARAGVNIIADRDTLFNHTGTGNAFTLDAGAASSGIFGCSYENIRVQGNSNSTYGMYVRGIHHSRFVHPQVLGCATTGAAFRIEWCVANTWDTPRCTSNGSTLSPIPLYGMYLTRRGSGSEHTTTQTILTPVMEGLSTANAVGLYFDYTSNNHIIGGTSESNIYGIRISANGGGGNFFSAIDLEANTTSDITVDDSARNLFMNCLSDSAVTITAGLNNMIVGGVYNNITISAGAINTQLIGPVYSSTGSGSITDNGTRTYWMGVANANTGAVEVGLKVPANIFATASLPAAGAGMNGSIIIEDAGAGDRNLIVYAGGQRFRIDGGASF